MRHSLCWCRKRFVLREVTNPCGRKLTYIVHRYARYFPNEALSRNRPCSRSSSRSRRTWPERSAPVGGARTNKWVDRRRVTLSVVVAIGMFAGIAVLCIPSALASNSTDYATVAGNRTSSTRPSASGSSALSTYLYGPNDVAVDGSGNPVISDTQDNEIEVLATSSTNPGYTLVGGTIWQPGNLYVIAGAGTSPTAPSISGSSALSTELNLPEGIAIDREGNVIVADSGSNLIAIIAVSPTNPGYDISSWTRGNVYAIAGNALTDPAPSYAGSSATTVGIDTPGAVAVDPDGNVVISDSFESAITVLAVSASQPWLPDQRSPQRGLKGTYTRSRGVVLRVRRTRVYRRKASPWSLPRESRSPQTAMLSSPTNTRTRSTCFRCLHRTRAFRPLILGRQATSTSSPGEERTLQQ